jgi:hypothetical protein
MRSAVSAARDAGVSIGVFSGNTSFWSARFTPDPWSGKAERTMVAYKTTESGGPDPSGIPTAAWRDPQGAGQPENELFGIQYMGENESNYFPLRITAEQASDPLFRHTGLEKIPPGAYVEIGKNLVGWEWDGLADNGATPKGVRVLFDSPVFGEILQDTGSDMALTKARVATTYYRAASGAIVFASGTIQWSWGLDLYEPDPRIQQITANVFELMGVRPATPAAALAVDGIDRPQENSGPAAAPKFATAAPLISGIRLDYSQPDGLTIRWQTDKPASGQVWFWQANSRGAFDARSVWNFPINGPDTELVQAHQVDLATLTPGTAYHIELVSRDGEGNIALSAPQTFEVPPGGLTERLADGFQTIKTDVVCGVKPIVAPAVNWVKQVNGWVLSGVVAGLFFIGGMWVVNRRRAG